MFAMYVHDHGGSLISISRVRLANVSAMFSYNGKKNKEKKKKEEEKEKNDKHLASFMGTCFIFYGHSVESLLISRNAILPYL